MRKNIANYFQQTTADEGYLKANTVRTRKAQGITLMRPINSKAVEAANQKIICDEAINRVSSPIFLPDSKISGRSIGLVRQKKVNGTLLNDSPKQKAGKNPLQPESPTLPPR